MEAPVIAPVAVGMEFCVVVRWADGAETRVNHFATSQDAQRWIDRESQDWVMRRGESQPPAERELAPLRGPRIRPLCAH